MTASKLCDAAPRGMRYRFGLRWLMLVVLMFSIAFAWFAHESHRVKHQTRMINALAQIEVRVRADEPTGLALVARKALGKRDVWLRQRIDESWFSRPCELVTWTANDNQITQLVELIGQVPTVRELHLEQSPITDQGTALLKRELPGVAVLTGKDLLSRSERPHTRFATAAVQLIGIAAAGLFCITMVLVWPLIRNTRTGERPGAR